MFSILRVLLIGAGIAGIVLAVLEARKGDAMLLQSIALKLVFVSDRVVLVLDS